MGDPDKRSNDRGKLPAFRCGYHPAIRRRGGHAYCDPATSDGSGNYNLAAPISEPGSYEVVASKTGFKDEAQSISITELGQEYTLDFRGDHGLIPNAPSASYAMDCVHYWLFPPGPECGLSAAMAMDIVHAWLYPA